MTFADAATRWMTAVREYAKPRTLTNYDGSLRRDILPALGSRELAAIRRRDLREFLLTIPGPASRARALSVCFAVFGQALEDELVDANPCQGLAKSLRLKKAKRDGETPVKAFTAEEAQHFLATTATMNLRHVLAVLFTTLLRTGMRIGEGLALKWTDLDGNLLTIRRTWHPHTMGSPKSGRSRRLELRPSLVALLDGWRSLAPASEWVFASPVRPAKPLSVSGAERAFKRVLKAAGLPLTLSCHATRHTYASILVARGESIVKVQQDLGHANIQITVGTYGSHHRAQSSLSDEERDSL